MKIVAGFLVFLMMFSSPSHAFISAIIGGAQSIKDTVYQKFMMLKAVQTLMVLRQNYVTSTKYYEMYKELNKGQGIIKNTANQIADVGKNQIEEAKKQFEFDWNRESAIKGKVENLMQRADDYISSQVKYAAEAFRTAVQNQEKAAEIGVDAELMNPTAAQKTALKAQALQLQTQAQTNRHLATLIDLNAKLYQLFLEEKKEKIKDQENFDQSISSRK